MTKSKITNHQSPITVWATRIIGIGVWNLAFILFSCSSKNAKYQQYFVQGQLLYEKNCSNCHQKNGKGLGLVYPPLASSDYLEKNFNHALCLMKYGTQGEIVVNGKNFNKPMPGVASLTDLEIAEIATYLNNAWGRQQGMVEINQVTKALGECGVR